MGLTGMAVCTTCSPEAYCFTDCHSLVLQKLKENLDINKGRYQAIQQCFTAVCKNLARASQKQ